jgi:hypothetical protein
MGRLSQGSAAKHKTVTLTVEGVNGIDVPYQCPNRLFTENALTGAMPILIHLRRWSKIYPASSLSAPRQA